MRSRWAVPLLCLAIASAACGSSSEEPEPVTLRWLAVGDSYSSGEGLPDIEGDCANSPSAYAPLLAAVPSDEWEVERFVFSACSGAVTEDWPDQVAAWDEGDPNLISATFGGNDVGFSDVFKDCIGLDDGIEFVDDLREIDGGSVVDLLFGRGCDIEEPELMSRLDELMPTLEALYESMAERVGPDGHVFILGYPAPLADPDTWPDPTCEGVSKGDAEMLLRAAVRINDVIAEATEIRSTVHFVDIAAIFDGHGRCAGPDWLYGLRDSLDSEDEIAGVPLIEAARPFHPTEDGHEAMAEALAEAFRTVLTADG